jgi:hypothetical protein
MSQVCNIEDILYSSGMAERRLEGNNHADRFDETLEVRSYRFNRDLFPRTGFDVVAEADEQMRTIFPVLNLNGTVVAVASDHSCDPWQNGWNAPWPV